MNANGCQSTTTTATVINIVMTRCLRTVAQPRFQSWGGPIPWSRLLYRTKYGWYTQFRALQSAAT